MTGFPWAAGDKLLADDLNAAIANAAAIGGPFLPVNSGSVSGGIVSGVAQFLCSGYYQFADGTGNPLLQIAAGTGNANGLTIYSGAAGQPVLARSPGPIQIQPGYSGIGGLSVFSNPTYSGSQWYELFNVNGTLAGATTSAQTTNVCHLTFVDSVDASGSATNLINYFTLDAQFGGATCRGYRQGIAAGVTLNQALTAPGANYVAVVGTAAATASAGGTGLTRTTAAGAVFGANFYAYTAGAAQNIGGVIGMELNPAIGTGTTALGLIGIQVVPTSAHVVRGAAHHDIGYLLAEQVGAAPIDIGYAVGDPNGQWPIRSDGALFRGVISSGTPAAAALHGVLLSEVSFPAFGSGPRGGAFVSNGFAVDGVGAIQCGPAYLTPSSTGMSVDVTGSVATGTPTVAAGGSGYTAGDVLYDLYGGVYLASTVSAGAVTAVTVYAGANGETHQPWCPSHTTPTNPVTTTVWAFRPGASGCTLNLTWNTTANTLSLNPTGKQVLTSLSAAATDAAAAAAGVPIGGLYNNAGVVHVRLT